MLKWNFLPYDSLLEISILLTSTFSMTLRTVPEKMRIPAGAGRMKMQSH